MNSIFRKTLIASALATLFSTVAIAAEDYSKTIDGSEPSSQSDMQRKGTPSSQKTTPSHEDEFNKTIDAEGPAAGNTADPKMQKSTDKPNAGEAEFNETIDADEPGSDDTTEPTMQKSDKPDTSDQSNTKSNRPLTEHQGNVTEEEEEEEETGNTQIDSETNIDMPEKMDEKPYGPTSAGVPPKKGGLYDMSANELNGMDVITSDGEDVGDIEKIVMGSDKHNVHAVVTVGGLLGVGGKTILIPLENFTRTNDEVHVKATQTQLKAMTDYGAEDYIELEGDAAISSALQP